MLLRTDGNGCPSCNGPEYARLCANGLSVAVPRLLLHNNGEALCFVAPVLWNDPDIIAAAVASIGPVAVENIRLDIAEAPGI